MIFKVQDIKRLEELYSFAESFTKEIKKQNQINTILLLEGEMGSGKTTFTSAFGKALGIKAKITSPTFIGINIYPSDIDLYHYDCYQVTPCLDGTLEILDNERKKVLVFEWSEKLDENLLEILKSKSLIYKINFSILIDNESNGHPEDEARRISITKLSNPS